MLRIRTLWLFGIAGLGLVASGCVSGDDRAFFQDDRAFFQVGWDLVAVGTTNDFVTCDEAGTPIVTLDMQRRGGQRIRKQFNCMDRGGQSDILPSGTYDVTIALHTGGPDGPVVSSKDGTFDLFRRGVTDLGVIAFQIQAWELHWSLQRGGAAVGCDQVGAATVRLITQTARMQQPLTYPFACGDGAGVTTAIPTDTYSVQVQLENAAGGVLSKTDPMTVVVTGAAMATLPPITFAVQ